MALLPARPNLDHLRREARDLLRAARAGDRAAAGRLQALSAPLTLAGAQLVLAREYGFASWVSLKEEVGLRSTELGRLAEDFCRASIGDWTGRAARLLESRPELATASFWTTLVLGDVLRVRLALDGEPALATRPDTATGWSPLHVACASRWHQLDPARADGLLAVASLLIEAGAEVGATARAGTDGGWTPLRCAVAGAANPAIAELLLRNGAVPADHDLYLAGFADDDHQCLRLLLAHAANVPDLARMALSAPISGGDLDGVRLLLEAGADPRKYLSDDEDPEPRSALHAAIRCHCGIDVVELLLAHGAEVELAGADGRSPYALAVSFGRADLAALLRRYGAKDDASVTDRFLSACLLADRDAADRELRAQPDLVSALDSERQAAALIQAAEVGNAAAVRVMLDLGFAVDAAGGGEGGTALHAAAYAGSADVVRLLIERGAEVERHDSRFDSAPLGWGVIGSGARPSDNPAPDWLGAIRCLIEAGASTHGITLSPDDPKPPSPAIAELLIAPAPRPRRRGATDSLR